MAHMSQEKKKAIAEKLKQVIPPTWKYSVGVEHHSTIRLTIWSAPIDLVAEWNRVCEGNHRGPEHLPFNKQKGHIQVNDYYLDRQFDESLPVFKAIHEAMNNGNHDRSDIQSDYFDVGWYVSINIGKWDEPFQVTEQFKPTKTTAPNSTEPSKPRMRPENIRMKEFLKANGIDATPKFIWHGSLARSWRIYNHDIKWTKELAAKFTALGFTGLHGPLGKHEGNGGVLSVFVRGHNELLAEQDSVKNRDDIQAKILAATEEQNRLLTMLKTK